MKEIRSLKYMYIESDLNEHILHKQKKIFNLDEALKAAGDFGTYHVLNLLFLSLVWVIIPSIPLMLPYFRMMPTFMCNDTDSTQRQCSTQEICDNTISKVIIPSPLKTWATDFDLYCEKSIYFGVLGALYFLGILIGNLFIAKFTDYYGRRPVLIAYLIAYLLISLLTVFAWTYYIFFFVSFSVGVIYSGTSMCAFIINFETSSKQRKSTFSTILSMSFGIGAIIHILIFLYFQNWIITVSITSILTVFLLLFTFHLQESPEFLYVKRRFSDMVVVLEYIAKMNKRTDRLEDYFKSTYIEKENETDPSIKEEVVYGVLEIMQLPEQRWILLIMAINWFVMTLTFYGINFNVSNFGTNPYLTGVLVYASESIAQMVCLYFILKYGFRYTLCGCYLLSAFALIFIYLVAPKTHWIVEFVLIFLSKFGISGVNNVNYIFTAELFPTIIRVAAMSYCSLMSRFGGISGTLMIEMVDYSMPLFGVMCLLSAFMLFNIEKIKNHEI